MWLKPRHFRADRRDRTGALLIVDQPLYEMIQRGLSSGIKGHPYFVTSPENAAAKHLWHNSVGLPGGWSLLNKERKVRSPQDSVPANGRGDSLQGVSYGKCHRKYTAWQRVRVKRCGKSAPRTEQSVRQGKPHVEQDQIGEEGRSAPFYFRVGR
jgi:hypothetical protein